MGSREENGWESWKNGSRRGPRWKGEVVQKQGKKSGERVVKGRFVQPCRRKVAAKKSGSLDVG